MSLFLVERPREALSGGLRPPFTERGELRLFVRREPFLKNCRDSLAVLFSHRGPSFPAAATYFSRGMSFARRRLPGRALSVSILLHCFLVALLGYQSRFVRANARPGSLWLSPGERVIYYRMPLLDPARLPRIAPSGPGGRPGSGSIPARLPWLGNTAKRPNMTIISKPLHPDNLRQTIYQRSSPPDLKIPAELKLPNILASRQVAVARPKTSFDPELAKPTQNLRQVPSVAAPSIGADPAIPLSASAKLLNAQPRLAIPLGGGAIGLQQPREASGQSAGAPSDQSGDLVVLGVDPADSSGQVFLPGGNRWGDFSLGPAGGAPGSPGGEPNGVANSGKGSGGAGGDGSTGLGSGGNGGGGGNSGSSLPVMVAALGPGAGPGGMLDPISPAALVFPVAVTPPSIRRNALVVSVGPVGGGGLNVYHALDCGNIYSIFLPMTSQNWSLQYCAKSADTPKRDAQVSNSTIHLEKPLIPPDPDLTHRFDFKRVPVPIELSHRTIVLKGVIALDGTVERLVVRQGVMQEVDEAARLAFSRWHFKPAMRDGKPVEVEILVGIPYMAGPDRINR